VEHERALLRSGARDKLLHVLSEEQLDDLVVREAGVHRTRLYPPVVTLGLFVEQVMSTDGACQDVVGRHLCQRAALRLAESSLNTGSYCKARQRLPLRLVEAAVCEVAYAASAALPPQARWRGREMPKRARGNIRLKRIFTLAPFWPFWGWSEQVHPGLFP
jgi:hypothetical protein